ncbi:probable ATP-dependent RNA helicase kurz [Ischnura elegans]|uniref:probable ATP-dependent RNA helicase kurz n=1 Tax=Ischnura elegans TaxID=197161 RepID=UPI001ED875CC|nr:probable ATP-dependent RNA helicase kurz [Ischnura elegans]
MGKTKKGFNWKARQAVQIDIDDSSTKKISVDSQKLNTGNYDECNALVLPSAKRATKKKIKKEAPTRILSKKQRKRLEKVLEQKKKKQNRASLLEALSQVKASPEVLDKMTSLASIQTKGLKRHFSEFDVKKLSPLSAAGNVGETNINSVKGSKKRKILLAMSTSTTLESKRDPTVVGLEESEEESDSDEESTVAQTDSEGEVDSQECTTLAEQSDVETDELKVEVNLMANIVKSDADSGKSDFKQPSVVTEKSVKIPLVPSTPAVFVHVIRDNVMQESRLKLPILGEEQMIMEAIKENPVVILAGETGSGKTTQVPQFLYEAGYALNGKMIGVTEPRRVAAISMSKRVAEEMNLSKEVSYLIRFEGNVSDDTRIKFMTDGVLLKEIQKDFLLTRYSVIIIDEAHERSVFSDILLGLLSRIVPLRNKRGDPMKLIVMSATLRLEDFTENPRLFRSVPPVIKVESRQYPVSIHFNRRTAQNYVREAFLKTCKIHSQLPEGGILVFLTGQQEVNTVVRRLRKVFPWKSKTNPFPNSKGSDKELKSNVEDAAGFLDSENENDIEIDMQMAIEKAKISRKKQRKSSLSALPNIDLNDYETLPADDTEGDLLDPEDEGALDSDDDLGDVEDLIGRTSQPMWVLPLYSLLSSEKQAKVFKPPPEGCRLVVVATNVAETSLTIPNIKYVVDCGKIKAKLYDAVTGVSAFKVVWTSKASANQRAGRAGRIGPGHCYRLYSSAVFNDEFPEYSIPEIQRRPVDDLMLQMKIMGIHKVVNFPFPSAPDLLQLRAAERRLVLLGALELPKTEKYAIESKGNVVRNVKTGGDNYVSQVTQLGRVIGAFPVSPRFGKMLALSHQHDGLLPLTICLVAALSIQEVFQVPQNAMASEDKKSAKDDEDTSIQQKKGVSLGNWCRLKWGGVRSGPHSILLGDCGALIRAVGAAEYAGSSEEFCLKAGLRHRAIMEIRKIRVQLSNEIALHIPNMDAPSVDPKMSPPSDLQAKLLRQIILAGMVDHVAHRVSLDEIKEDEDKEKWRNAYRCSEMEDPVFLHSSSVLRKELPEWVVFQEVFESTKLYIRGLTAIEPEWLPTYAPALCNLSDPLDDPPPRYDHESDRLMCHVSGTFGRAAWSLPIIEVDYPPGLERYKWFAVFLLEGEVFPRLKSYKSSLLSVPNIMLKSWARMQSRTEIILSALTSHGVDSKGELMKMWRKEPTYLLSAYLKWLPESAHNEVSLIWPPLEE